jgi:hypothetical protein
MIYDETDLENAVVIARTIRGQACGFEKALGEGMVIHLGTWLGFDTEGHKPVYETLLKRSGAKLRQVSANNEYITARERFTEGHSAMLFIGNYYNEEQAGKVSYTHPVTGETVSIPYKANEMTWPALYGVLTPVCMTVAWEIKLLHSTSDILDVKLIDDRIEIKLCGDRDLQGEIVFEGAGAVMIKSVAIDGVKVEMVLADERLVIHYNHKLKEEVKMIINL